MLTTKGCQLNPVKDELVNNYTHIRKLMLSMSSPLLASAGRLQAARFPERRPLQR